MRLLNKWILDCQHLDQDFQPGKAQLVLCQDYPFRPVHMIYVLSTLIIVIAYMIGSLSFGVLISRTMGLSDPRTYGSGNPGATNVLRSGNKKAALFTLLLDAVKGYLPVLVVQWITPRWPIMGQYLPEALWMWVGLAAFIGHLWPVFFQFKGGKGVATAAGVLLAFHPLLGGATLLVWLITAYLSRYSSLAALIAALFAPVFQMMVWNPSVLTLVVLIMSGLLVWRHESNISKLLKGQESKIGQKAKSP